MSLNSDPRAGSRPTVTHGIATTGPALLSHGFRPFFLGAGILAIVAMTAWIGALTLSWQVGGDYGALNWHAHEMLFGYTSAALPGFLLTAIPNWTGRRPVTGMRLLALAGLWAAGRLVLFAPGILGMPASIIVEAIFMPSVAVVAGGRSLQAKTGGT